MRTSLLLMSTMIVGFGTAKAESINCGNKAIVVQDGKIVSITHEDGSTHRGAGVSDNWQYDGKSIKHRLDKKAISCGTKPKSAEVLAIESAVRFSKEPAVHGLTASDGKLLSAYASNLLKQDPTCKYIIDGAKSSFRNEMYYLDCRDSRGESDRRWITRSELLSGQVGKGTNIGSDGFAIHVCHNELKAKLTNPSTYNPAILGVTSRAIPQMGRNAVTVEFTAKNALGAEGKFLGECLIENGRPLEAKIQQR